MMEHDALIHLLHHRGNNQGPRHQQIPETLAKDCADSDLLGRSRPIAIPSELLAICRGLQSPWAAHILSYAICIPSIEGPSMWDYGECRDLHPAVTRVSGNQRVYTSLKWSVSRLFILVHNVVAFAILRTKVRLSLIARSYFFPLALVTSGITPTLRVFFGI